MHPLCAPSKPDRMDCIISRIRNYSECYYVRLRLRHKRQKIFIGSCTSSLNNIRSESTRGGLAKRHPSRVRFSCDCKLREICLNERGRTLASYRHFHGSKSIASGSRNSKPNRFDITNREVDITT